MIPVVSTPLHTTRPFPRALVVPFPLAFVGPFLPSEARHARSEAPRFVTATCTYHSLKTAHNTNERLRITLTKSLT